MANGLAFPVGERKASLQSARTRNFLRPLHAGIHKTTVVLIQILDYSKEISH